MSFQNAKSPVSFQVMGLSPKEGKNSGPVIFISTANNNYRYFKYFINTESCKTYSAMSQNICCRFLDDRLFATCSDDTTVALWDARYLKHNVQMFRGHSNWVKNIEYDSRQGILLTSGFDGSIYTWNINR